MNGIGFIILSTLLLIAPGAIYNNLNNSGLVVAGTQLPSTCDSTLDICTYPNNVANVNGTTGVGCQANPSVCQLNGRTISFLNKASPFTLMLQGNVFALFTNVNGPGFQGPGAQASWGGSHGPFDLTGNPVYYSTDCFANSPFSGSQTGLALGHCTQTNTDNSNVTLANAATWENWNTAASGQTKSMNFYQTGNATYPWTCSWIAQINYTALANGPGFTYYGCTIYKTSNSLSNTLWGILFAYPVSNGPVVNSASYSHYHMYAQLENWETQTCVLGASMGNRQSAACDNFRTGFKGYTVPGTSSQFVPNAAGAVIFGFLAGVVILVLGLGLQFGIGGGVSVGVNRQGTKLFQVLGLGLILWTFFYSEFSSWFTSGTLPFGLDGAAGIVSVFLTGLFFGGIFWWSTAG